jgi:hypothetical protein
MATSLPKLTNIVRHIYECTAHFGGANGRESKGVGITIEMLRARQKSDARGNVFAPAHLIASLGIGAHSPRVLSASDF